MRKFVAFLSLATVIALALSVVSLAGSRSTGWLTNLTVASEIPKQVVKNTAANGYFSATLTGNKLKFTLTFQKLTGPATMAHIHLGAVGVSGRIVVPLCAPCKSPASGCKRASKTAAPDRRVASFENDST